MIPHDPENMTNDDIDRLSIEDVPPDRVLQSEGVSQSLEKMENKERKPLSNEDKLSLYKRHLRIKKRKFEPPSGDEAYAEMEKYLRDKYTLNEWADMMDANPILIELIKNEEYQNAVDRADYLANDDNSLVDSEDADKLREVTKV